MSDQFDNKGKVALWVNQSQNPKAPKYKGHAFAHRDIKAGEQVAISLWDNEPVDRRPIFRGKMEDMRARPDASQPSAPAPSPAQATADFDDSDIPF